MTATAPILAPIAADAPEDRPLCVWEVDDVLFGAAAPVITSVGVMDGVGVVVVLPVVVVEGV